MGKKKYQPQVLQQGEFQRSDGLYCKYVSEDGKRKRVTANTLEKLRDKVASFEASHLPAVKTETLNDVYRMWFRQKDGIRERTAVQYKWQYTTYMEKSELGSMPIQQITKGKLKLHYMKLRDQKGLTPATIDSLNVMVRQVFDYAIEERIIASNPSVNIMKEMKKKQEDEMLKQGSVRKQAHPALTKAQQDRFMSFMKNSALYRHWYPIFATIVGTGMRVEEVTALQWSDIDFEHRTIQIHKGLALIRDMEHGGMKWIISPPKNKGSFRTSTMLDDVKAALEEEREFQQSIGLKCKANVDGYNNFVFINRNGNTQHQGTLNKALRRIIRDANCEATDNESLVMLPYFSCHCLRSTFVTRCAEEGVPIAVTMAQVGHTDRRTTEEVYTTVSEDWKLKELQILNSVFSS